MGTFNSFHNSYHYYLLGDFSWKDLQADKIKYLPIYLNLTTTLKTCMCFNNFAGKKWKILCNDSAFILMYK